MRQPVPLSPGDRSRRPKVVHVVVGGQIGGVARFLVDLASRPEATGADHSIALMTHDETLRDMLRRAGLRVHDAGHVGPDPLSYVRLTFGRSRVEWLGRVLREEDADLVHLHTYKSHVIGVRAARRQALPILRTEHGVGHFTDPSCIPFRRWALRHADRVVAVSGYVGRYLHEAAREARGKVRVIRNGVDAERFRAQAPPHDGPFTFSVVCRLEPWKQVDFAIEAVACLPDVRLLIAGEGSARTRLEALMRRRGLNGRVIFLGFQQEPQTVLAQSDVSINSSRNEPLGLAVLESLASQRPVVAFDGGGIPEIVQDGQTGWLVAEQTVQALTTRMAQASSSRAHAAALGANGRAFVERACTISEMCRDYAHVYAELTNAPRRTYASTY